VVLILAAGLGKIVITLEDFHVDMVLKIGQAVQLLLVLVKVLQLDAHELRCGVSVHFDKECAEIVVLNVSCSELGTWLRELLH
jgi:hypothetical protein